MLAELYKPPKPLLKRDKNSLVSAKQARERLAARVIRIRFPRWAIGFVSLIPPRRPTFPFTACKQFQEGSHAAGFNNRILFIGLSGVFALSAGDVINLAATGCESTSVLSTYSK